MTLNVVKCSTLLQQEKHSLVGPVPRTSPPLVSKLVAAYIARQFLNSRTGGTPYSRKSVERKASERSDASLRREHVFFAGESILAGVIFVTCLHFLLNQQRHTELNGELYTQEESTSCAGK